MRFLGTFTRKVDSILRFPEPSKLHLSSQMALVVEALLLIAIVVVVSGTIWRSIDRYHQPGEFDMSRQGMFDFHNGIYFPAVALCNGYDPYGPEYVADFPVTRQIPPYSPFALVVHYPFGWMSLRTAEVVYCCFTTLLLIAIGIMSISGLKQVPERFAWTLLAILLVLASRSGHTTLYTGYFTAELVLGILIAVKYADSRPVISGLGVAIASIKPNFGLPLILLLAARGNWRATAFGTTFSILGALLGTGLVLQHVDLTKMIEDVKSSDQAHVTDDYELPINTWTRIDALAIVAKWSDTNPDAKIALGVMLVLLIVPCIALKQLRRGGDYSELLSYSGVLILAVSTAAIYHHVYDALVLIPAATSLLLDTRWQAWFSLPIRLLLSAGFLFVPWNYLSSEIVLNRLNCTPEVHKLLTSTSGMVLFLCCFVLCLLPLLSRIKQSSNEFN